MNFIGIDLGSTNLKASLYDEAFQLLGRASRPVAYVKSEKYVEFPAETYFETLLELLEELLQTTGADRREIAELVFTGQAESLVVLGAGDRPLMNAISWMDERSVEECEALSRQFPPEVCERITGQQAVLPTWPATKILWLKNHRPELYGAAETYMLLKDYIVFRCTGVKQADASIATFSFYFDIYEKTYWADMLQALGLRREQLPPLVEPCTVAGTLREELARRLGLPDRVKVNHGTLDHFTGMIGTGNIRPGGVSLSTGTVMAMAALVPEPVADRNCGIAMHYGFLPDTHIMLPVAESGGVSLEWFRRTCLPDADYGRLNRELEARSLPGEVIFLPYLVGTNAPEFDRRASGVFWGLRAEQDAWDLAGAVMCGVACLLRKNCDAMKEKGAAVRYLIATGGGAKSDLWCQLQADFTGVPVYRPVEMEAACLGAAVIGAVSEGVYGDYAQAVEKAAVMERCFTPAPTDRHGRYYRRFSALYQASVAVAELK